MRWATYKAFFNELMGNDVMIFSLDEVDIKISSGKRPAEMLTELLIDKVFVNAALLTLGSIIALMQFTRAATTGWTNEIRKGDLFETTSENLLAYSSIDEITGDADWFRKPEGSIGIVVSDFTPVGIFFDSDRLSKHCRKLIRRVPAAYYVSSPAVLPRTSKQRDVVYAFFDGKSAIFPLKSFLVYTRRIPKTKTND